MHPFLSLPSPWLVAHRGGSALAPENTLPAFDVAAELGADAIETDVRRTRDGVVIVFHDETTERITGAPGTVEGRTLEELRTLDAAFGFTPDGGRTFPRRGTGVRIPTFAEALARYPAMRFIVDAKSEEPALAEALAAAIRAAGAEHRVCVGSFFDAQAERLGAIVPACARYLPQEAATCHVLAALSGGDASACPGGYALASLPARMNELEVVCPPVIAHFHGRGMPVHAWTVDAADEMRALLAMGVDAIVTDRPDVLRAVLGR
ncbi:glycerophosphodiester phosphodiesterase [Anaeromyxobacter sp. SG64]|uniref:glycerophosphodiester phosphodiesterase n=1 Tax=Anaeromyxobacter sp. SG64 TaxID=2925409 RepID=UPI001F59C0AF|nr:glycerophosphodiester phosphodiesterase [Anaeromyxobacter sp. SG64]